MRKLLGVVEDLEARHVLAVQSNARSLRELLSPVAPQCVVHDVSSLLLQPGAEPQPPVAPEETCFYQLTSGSTGKSKVIPECHSAIIAHARHSAAHCNYSSLVCSIELFLELVHLPHGSAGYPPIPDTRM